MIRKFAAALAALSVVACTARVAPPTPVAPHGPVEVQILAFNDLHGNLQVPDPVEVTEPDGTKHKITTGGVAASRCRAHRSSRRSSEHDYRVGGRHDRRIPAHLR